MAELGFEELAVDHTMLGTDRLAGDEQPDAAEGALVPAVPLFWQASGLCTHNPVAPPPGPQPNPAVPTLRAMFGEELRLDIDGRYPQMVASGIMFDDLGPNHRQGTAVFNGSLIGNVPTGDPAPAASVDRIKFWTAVHELGHTFNLAHAWQKSWGTPWILLTEDPEVPKQEAIALMMAMLPWRRPS
jgi:hypothetical protein